VDFFVQALIKHLIWLVLFVNNSV